MGSIHGNEDDISRYNYAKYEPNLFFKMTLAKSKMRFFREAVKKGPSNIYRMKKNSEKMKKYENSKNYKKSFFMAL